ncbi:MAG: ABC transporter permease [Gammaproteobacteria bacterium]|nr:ABC transporter permease [Gammaproteobacteria bacterium]MYI89860.1 ABC transporter permease [Gammaproteobacteria bacterium]
MTRALLEIYDAPLSAKFGLLIIAIYIFVALFAPWVAPFGESEIVGRKFQPWDDQFLLGTDHLGRDMLTRILYGARNTVGIALLTTFLAFILGGVLGILAAVLGGWLDQLLSRIVDVFMAIPALIFAMMLLSIFGTSIINLIIIMSVIDATRIFRIARAVSLNVVVMDYIEAARLRGEKLTWLTISEILPNISAPLAAEFGLRFCFVFLTISALSFLGIGIQPPIADWGSMVRQTAVLITFDDYTPLIPAAAIALLTVAVNFVIDWFLHKTSGLKDEV